MERKVGEAPCTREIALNEQKVTQLCRTEFFNRLQLAITEYQFFSFPKLLWPIPILIQRQHFVVLMQ